MLLLQQLAYSHPNRDVLLSGIDLVVNRKDKIALIGNNGVGKSTLLKILAGELHPTSGTITREKTPYYVPQVYGRFNDLNVAQALRVDHKLTALKEILNGDLTASNLQLLDEDWNIEERCSQALSYWGLNDISLNRNMDTLSGGQKTKVFLSGIMIHDPGIVLLDEPGNHLDLDARKILYEYIRSTNDTVIIVSHDRTVLNLIETICELDKKGLKMYGGNYDFYKSQKQIASDALFNALKSKEKALKNAREIERASIERKQKLDERGKKKQEKAGVPTITMNTLKNNAEKSTSKIKAAHTEKITIISEELNLLRNELPGIDAMKLGLDDPSIHYGKILVTARDINVQFKKKVLWKTSISFEVRTGDRVAIKGANGTGKTTLFKLITGQLKAASGILEKSVFTSIYIDQDYSLIDNALNVYSQVQNFNPGRYQEHEIKNKLSRFLFTKEYWDKPCRALSGGEKMRLMLCCLTTWKEAPEMILLDEPTNNLDIRNIEILTMAMKEYRGTLLVVSHDKVFLNEIGVRDFIHV